MEPNRSKSKNNMCGWCLNKNKTDTEAFHECFGCHYIKCICNGCSFKRGIYPCKKCYEIYKSVKNGLMDEEHLLIQVESARLHNPGCNTIQDEKNQRDDIKDKEKDKYFKQYCEIGEWRYKTLYS